MSLNFLATRFRCAWPWDILVMLCDGRFVCGCADPYGRRVLGDARRGGVRDAWTGQVITKLRQDLNGDRKSTRLNSSHRCISYAVFCLKKKKIRTSLVLPT